MQVHGGNLAVQGMHQGYVYSRRVLLHGHRESYAVARQEAPAGDGAPVAGSTFDANVVMILAVLLCALICALGLNSIVRCALRCSSTRMTPAAAGSRELGSVARLAQAGVRRKALRAMPTLVYSAGQALGPSPAPTPACAICLADLEPGERVRVLPKCNHGFHVRCVDRWLMARSTCPTCRQPLFGEPQKASGCAEAVHQDDGGAAPVRSFFVPLPPEGLVTPYDF
ncbi:RING-H2 finger protein ATL74-like [Lolium rigidum]|uniref:RING-H2 finger protein ATL74-like n=1 Tax=Lolium rigidum TaxID=89674 RepID=UPI001F5C29A2|nr:RING-H2 finger protein ATL74-like [Lolium rigidum]